MTIKNNDENNKKHLKTHIENDYGVSISTTEYSTGVNKPSALTAESTPGKSGKAPQKIGSGKPKKITAQKEDDEEKIKTEKDELNVSGLPSSAINALHSAAYNILNRETTKPAYQSLNNQEVTQLNTVLQEKLPKTVAAVRPAKRNLAAMDLLKLNTCAFLGGTGELTRKALGLEGHFASTEAHDLNTHLKERQKTNQMLPVRTCSDYRVTRIEAAVTRYQEVQEQFWHTASLKKIMQRIEATSHKKGALLTNVVEQMKPGGKLASLGDRFRETLKTDPEARKNMRTLDQALDSFIHQYRYGIHELRGTTDKALNEKWLMRINGAFQKMRDSAATLPPDGVNQSHLEKLETMTNAITEKLKGFFSSLFSKLKGG